MVAAALAFFVGLVQGLVHGLGPDHCAALATLGTSSRGDRFAAFRVAVRFALGHALMLGALAVLCVAMGIGISEAFERWAEIAGGVVLVGLGVAALFFPSALRHGHPHLPGHDHSHSHPPADRSARISTAAGALMAVSGARALLLALPPLVVGGAFQLEAWTYLPGFALGILVSMGAVGLLVGAGAVRLGDRLQRIAAVAAGVIGVYWIVDRL
ncbi:MAG: hypothetical protein IRZ16_06010 [Myxococcaceae bacterium]|nr:hypothetical protein [Myxococcaceae bacterium]